MFSRMRAAASVTQKRITVSLEKECSPWSPKISISDTSSWAGGLWYKRTPEKQKITASWKLRRLFTTVYSLSLIPQTYVCVW